MNRLAALPPDSLVDKRYLIKKVLGQGGMGRTYLVSDQQCFNKLLVLKEFVPGSTEEYILQKSRALFRREAEVLYQLNHPQIPKFYGHFEERARLFLVQDYIKGKSYRQFLEQGKIFSEMEVIQWLKDLLPVLDYIHQKNIIHRDISPDNVMLVDSEEFQEGEEARNKLMLIDFGVVKQAENQVTSNYSIVGKLGYSPPEQIRLGQCYPTSDLYALAVSALVLLTGKEPQILFDSYSTQWQWQNYIKLSENLPEIIEKMLAEIPQERYQSAQEVLAKLNNPSFVQSPPAKTEIIQPKLPENQPNITGNVNKKNPLKILPWAAVVAVFLVGGITPHIAGVCNSLNNCAQGSKFQQVFDQATEKAETAIQAAEKAKNLAELQSSSDRLQSAITELTDIPEDVNFYGEVKEVLIKYQSKQEEIAARLQEESKKQPLW
ncbi:MAG: serine/threonine protein kinase [Gomphosphaeria aponina SAG 52.96 = DSM 107014]|uniref:non-specific serine/threonine protein kinase n=1 Tax=Gomphosphaeria aponina SAG 52.96 = DSM 107014 TaxID=1521640 RepID=A0A941GMX2_9CHRO|nr:serine/threonine protein kinase [Gomphosphaeria aponina SAG 52.96 = DSM 107014]